MLLTLIVLLALAGCVTPPPATIPPDLDTYSGLAAALAEIDAGGTVVFLYDVRTPEEYISGHIPGAINVPVSEIPKGIPRKLKHQPVVVYCQAGGRAMMASTALTDKGFTNVANFSSVANWEGALVTGPDPR